MSEGDTLFPVDPRPARGGRGDRPVRPLAPDEGARRLARALPASIRLGTSSWSFPGWAGLVYGERASERRLSRAGLCAYATHPLLRVVGLDRTHYAPMSAAALRRLAAQTPAGFRFVVKAHEALTHAVWPRHRRYGPRAGERNPSFLDTERAMRTVVDPALEGLGERLSVLLFQFAPQPLAPLGGPGGFVERLEAFLARLPKEAPLAVEIRNAAILEEAAFARALRRLGVLPGLAVHPRLPPLREQAERTDALSHRRLLVRWLLAPGLDYEAAAARFAPFDRLRAEDPATRADIAGLVARAQRAGAETDVVVNNKAEGSAPLSVTALARAIAERLRRKVGSEP